MEQIKHECISCAHLDKSMADEPCYDCDLSCNKWEDSRIEIKDGVSCKIRGNQNNAD